MKYLPRLSLSVWALLALLGGGSLVCLSPAWSADQKPLVINPTTGKTEQMQTGNNLLIPGTSTLTVSSLTSGRIPFASTAGLVTDNANLVFGSNNTIIGVGRTPHTWGSNYRGMECKATSFVEYNDGASNIQCNFLGNVYDSGAGAFKYVETGGVAAFRMIPTSRLFTWSTAPSGAPDATVTFAEAMRLDNTALTVASTVSVIASNTTNAISKDTGAFVTEGGIGAEKTIYAGTGFITQTGNVYANVAAGTVGYLIADGSNTGSGNGAAMIIRSNGANLLSIGNMSAVTGGAYSATPYIDANAAITIADPINVAGNVAMTVAGNGLLVKEGTNAKMGASVLVGGTVTVNTTAVTASSRIYLTSQADGGTVGFQRISARTAATSFTITSSSVLDTSTVAWMIVEPAP